MKIKNPTQYSTDSIYEASFLIARGFIHLGIENSGSAYKKIIFSNSPELEKAVSIFYSNGKISVLSFVNAYKRMKGEIFSQKSN